MSFDQRQLDQELGALSVRGTPELAQLHLELFGKLPRCKHRAHLLRRCAWKSLENRYGGLSRKARQVLDELEGEIDIPDLTTVKKNLPPTRVSTPAIGTVLSREWKGETVRVTVTSDGFRWKGTTFGSLSAAARAVTGTRWNGLVFFGAQEEESIMNSVRVAVYTRKSTDAGLEQAFNSLDAQREAVEAYVKSQRGEGWTVIPKNYDDGGYTGANTDRPAFQELIQDIKAGSVDVVAVYKIDRLSRSLADFARVIELFDKHSVSFVSVTQHFHTATSMGRLTLNILMSFAEFERQVIAERTRDKMQAMRRRGEWTGSAPVLGYDAVDKKLVVNEVEAERVRAIFDLFLELGTVGAVVRELEERGWRTKSYTSRRGRERGGGPWTKPTLRNLLTQPIYVGKIRAGDDVVEGVHEAIVDPAVWEAVQGRFTRKSRRRGVAWSALLNGLLRCGECGSHYTHHTTRKGTRRYRYYVCQTQIKRGATACPKSRVGAEEIEGFVCDQIRQLGSNPRVIEQVARELASGDGRGQHCETRAGLESARRKLDGQRRHLVDAIAATGANKTLLAKLERTDGELEALEVEIARTRSEAAIDGDVDVTAVQAALAAWTPVWEQLKRAEQAELVSLLFEGIDYSGQSRSIEFTLRDDAASLLQERALPVSCGGERLR